VDTEARHDATFRTAALDDIDGIVAIHTASREVAYRGRMPDDLMDYESVEDRRRRWHDRLTSDDPHAVTWIAGLDGRISGFAHASAATSDQTDPSWHVHLLYIAPGLQGLGLGRALLERATATIAAAGFPRATLDVFGFNEEAIRFYEHLGWVRVGALEDMPIPGFLYELRLSPSPDMVR